MNSIRCHKQNDSRNRNDLSSLSRRSQDDCACFRCM